MLDLTTVLREELQSNKRKPDGLLHASSHLTGSLRHVQLELAGAPRIEESLVRQMPLVMGNALHTFLHEALRKRGAAYMGEVDVTEGCPEGWGGTADILQWNTGAEQFQLLDVKTMRGEGIYYLSEGPKIEHVWQVSMYYHALVVMGLPMNYDIGVYYLPKNEVRGKDVEPTLVMFEPLTRATVYAEANRRIRRVDEYLNSLGVLSFPNYITDALEPVQERVQKITFDKKTETYDVKLTPHWSTMYCPFPTELCDCREQGVTKIGFYDTDGETYIPRSGFEEIEPNVFPS